MRRSNAYLEHLRAVPMFAACSQKELATLGRSGTVSDVESGTELCREGAIGREFMVIVDGKAVVSRNGHEVATLGPGDFFGELSLLDNTPRDATVTASTPMTVFVMTPAEFGGVLTTAPSVTRKLLIGMARRLHELDRRI
jgi:CRP-like cAMP-binding protein